VALGIGDDGALINPSPDTQLVMASDTLVESVHFPAGASSEQIATRALCVNLSDMAAMGATPKWFTLALTIPKHSANEQWLKGFSYGLADVANEFDLALVGGDTTLGPLTISITMLGEVPIGQALQRNGALVGDAIYVTGTLADGAAALNMLKADANAETEDSERLLARFYRPQPQIEAGIALRNIASACIDISDGLIADLGHICQASGVKANLVTQWLPIHRQLRDTSAADYLNWALSGGDEYQLCFTLSGNNKIIVDQWIAEGKLMATMIGQITEPCDSGSLVTVDQQSVEDSIGGFDHFNN
jgi:thiamine-monophosphate kinase